MTTSLRRRLLAMTAIFGLAGGCVAGQDPGMEIDPSLEQIDGKGDGPRTPIDPDGTYRLEITSVQADELNEWLREPALYVATGDARTPTCLAHQLICEYTQNGRLLLDDGRERTYSGRELRDGMEYRLFDEGGARSSSSSPVDKLLGINHFSLFGADVSFSVKRPFSSNRTFVIRARWV